MAIKSKDKVIKRYPNGATLIYYRQDYNKTTKAAIGFKTGARTDGNQFGKTHFLEHMLFHNCNGMSESEFMKVTANYDGMQNAETGYNYVVTEFDCPNDNLENLIILNRDILQNRNFTEENVEKEREVVYQEMMRYIEEDRASFYYFFNSLLEENPNKLISILGYEQTLEKITRQDLVDHANSTFVSENLVASVTSSLPFEEIEKLFEKHIMNAFPSNPQAEVYDVLSLYKCNQNYVVQNNKSSCSTAEVCVFFKDKQKIFKQRGAYTLLEDFIFNGMSGRLHEFLRLKNQLCYSSEFMDLDLSEICYKGIYVTTTPNKINTCIDVIAELIEDVRKNGITKEEFEGYKKFIKNQKQRLSKVHLPPDPINMLENFINTQEPFSIFKMSDFENITYEQANEHMKSIFKDTNVVVKLVGKYNKNDVYKNQEICKKLGALEKTQSYTFDINELAKMSYKDIYSFISTHPLTDKERYVAIVVADYNRDKQIKEQQTVRSHNSEEGEDMFEIN